GGELAYLGLHAALGCAASAAEGAGCEGGAIGGAVSAFSANSIAAAVTGGQGVSDAGQLAMITAATTLLGGGVAAALGQNAIGAMNAAANETLNNACSHDCGDKTGHLPSGEKDTASILPKEGTSDAGQAGAATGAEPEKTTVGAGALVSALAGANHGSAANGAGNAIQTYWPTNGGFLLSPTIGPLDPGYQFSRYGGFFNEAGQFQDFGN
ncbi:hypothetical protein B0G57_1161, partial [Trinickia symbiotica]